MQDQIIEFIKVFTKQNGYPPTRQEIADSLSVYPNTINWHIKKMVESGVISVAAGVSRGITINKAKRILRKEK